MSDASRLCNTMARESAASRMCTHTKQSTQRQAETRGGVQKGGQKIRMLGATKSEPKVDFWQGLLWKVSVNF